MRVGGGARSSSRGLERTLALPRTGRHVNEIELRVSLLGKSGSTGQDGVKQIWSTDR